METKKVIIQFGRIVGELRNPTSSCSKKDGRLVTSIEYDDWIVTIKDKSIVVSGASSKAFPLEDGTLFLCNDKNKNNKFVYFRSKELLTMCDKFEIRLYKYEETNKRFIYKSNQNVNLYTDGELIRKDLSNTIIFTVTDSTFVLEEVINGEGIVNRVLYTKENPLSLELIIDSIINKND